MDDLLEHLKKVKFEKQLHKLNKKLHNKKVVIYGTGLLFQRVIKNYDLSKLDIIGISDMKYSPEQEGTSEFGYKIIPLDKIASYKPDYVLISTINFLNIMENFKNNVFADTKIKILPLVDKSFWMLLKEIFG